jgi:predicted negative regulator of RcsB-dependent stress response
MASGERLVALASEHGFSAWTDFALVLLPTARKERLESEALARLYRLVEEGQSPYRRVFCLCVLAELYGSADLVEQGLSVLASISEENRRTFYAPEIPRLEGELFLRCPDSSAAEGRFRQAIELSRTRAEKSLELRASMSLARLLASQGRRDEARSTLAPIYGWFTEGFGTADLRAAKALLDGLSAAST